MNRFDREFVAEWIVFGLVVIAGWWCAYHIGLWIMGER